VNAAPQLAASTALDLGVRVLAVALLHNAVQIVASRADFEPGGALDARLVRLRAANTLDRTYRRLVRRTVPPARLALLTAAVQVAGALLLLPFPRLWPALLVLWLVEAVNQPLLRPGLDGGDEMLRVVTVVMFLRALTGQAIAQQAAAAFLAFLLCLAYAVSGLSKGQSIMWWSGSGLRGVLSTQYFGIAAVGRRLNRGTRLAQLLGWMTLLGESLFFVCVLAGPRAALVGLAGALFFHLACGVVMGLDGFTLPFAASFPCAYWASGWLAGHVPAEVRLLAGAILVCAVVAWLAHWRSAELVRYPGST